MRHNGPGAPLHGEAIPSVLQSVRRLSLGVSDGAVMMLKIGGSVIQARADGRAGGRAFQAA